MNRYVVDGLLIDMHQGKRVLYLGPSRLQARDMLHQLGEHLLPGEKLYRTHGAERVTSPSGGEIRLHSVNSSLRGMSPDVIVIDGDVTDSRQQEDLWVLLNRPGSELIRA